MVAVVTLVIVSAPLPGIAGVAAGVFFGLAAAGIVTPPIAALAAAAAIGPMAYADWQLATGASAAAMAVATVPVLLVGLARAPRPAKRATAIAIGLAVLIGVVGAVGGLVSALQAKSDVDRAVDLATAGIDKLGDDDAAARTDLLDAADSFDSAETTLRAWWVRPALMVPGVAQQSRAVSTMASAGSDLARTAAEASADADIDSIRPKDGQVDLQALAALQDPLDRSLAALRSADRQLDDVRSPLLVSPVADRLTSLRDKVSEALGNAELASQAVSVAPDMLGARRPPPLLPVVPEPVRVAGRRRLHGQLGRAHRRRREAVADPFGPGPGADRRRPRPTICSSRARTSSSTSTASRPAPGA